MKTLVMSSLILFASVSLAQQRCEMIFASQNEVVNELARLYVDVENSPNSLLQNTLKKELRKKRRAAEKAYLDLSELNTLIQELRTKKNEDRQNEEKQKEKITDREERTLHPLVEKVQLETTKPLGSIRFSSDNKWVFGKTQNKTLLFDTATGKLKKMFSPDSFVSESGKWEIHMDWDSLRFLDIDQGRLQAKIDWVGPATDVHISLDDRFMVTGVPTENDPVTLWDFTYQKPLGNLPISGGLVNMHFSADGNRLIILTDDGTAAVWDTGTLKKLHEHTFAKPEYFGDPPQIRLNTQGTQAVLETSAVTYDLWDLSSNQVTEINSQSWSHQVHRYINMARAFPKAPVSLDLYNVHEPKPFASLMLGIKVPYSMGMNSDGTEIVTSNSDGKTVIWKLVAPNE
jgi:WD40 repeat protein